MSILVDVLRELWAMFLTDARLALFILALVAVTALLTTTTALPPVFDGAVLLFGCIAILVEAVVRGARTTGRR
jgi:hypothetical protein